MSHFGLKLCVSCFSTSDSLLCSCVYKVARVSGHHSRTVHPRLRWYRYLELSSSQPLAVRRQPLVELRVRPFVPLLLEGPLHERRHGRDAGASVQVPEYAATSRCRAAQDAAVCGELSATSPLRTDRGPSVRGALGGLWGRALTPQVVSGGVLRQLGWTLEKKYGHS
jgi:hypothetical protein